MKVRLPDSLDPAAASDTPEPGRRPEKSAAIYAITKEQVRFFCVTDRTRLLRGKSSLKASAALHGAPLPA